MKSCGGDHGAGDGRCLVREWQIEVALVTVVQEVSMLKQGREW